MMNGSQRQSDSAAPVSGAIRATSVLGLNSDSNLNLTAPTFQSVNDGQENMQAQLYGAAPDPVVICRAMTVQEYEAMLDQNYVVDQYCMWDQLLCRNDVAWQHNYDELQWENDQLQAEQTHLQQTCESVQTVRINEDPLQNSTALNAVDITA